MEKNYSSIRIYKDARVNFEDEYCDEVRFFISLDGTMFIAFACDIDEYRSNGGIYEATEPIDMSVMKEIFSADGNVEIFDDSCDCSSETLIVVDGKIVISAGCQYYDEYYPSGWAYFYPEGKENCDLDAIRLRNAFKDLEFDMSSYQTNVTSTGMSYVITGQPRVGKTTFSKRFKWTVVDTDAFENPLDVINHINGQTCYVIGKWRDINVVTEKNEGLTYDDFIRHLLYSQGLDCTPICLQEGKREFDGIAMHPSKFAKLDSDFDLSEKEGFRNIVQCETYISGEVFIF